MNIDDLNRKIKKVIALVKRFIKNPNFTYDDFKQFEFEKRVGIETRGFVAEMDLGISKELEPFHYVPGGNIYLTRLLKRLNVNDSDSIIDLGCGLGSPMFYMMKFPFKKISGIEYSKELYEGCKRNIDKLNDSRLNVFYGDAGNFDSFDDYNYIFMFNPFGLPVMRKVLDNIHKSYSNCPRIITIIYKNPVYNNEILKDGTFHKLLEYKTESSFNFYVYRTQIGLD
jgi:predicted RNA methylase